MPDTITLVGSGTSKVIPAGAAKLHGMAETELQLEIGALEDRPIADPDDVELSAETLGDPLDHVGEQRPRQAVQRPALPLIVSAGDGELCRPPGRSPPDRRNVALQAARARPLHRHPRRRRF